MVGKGDGGKMIPGSVKIRSALCSNSAPPTGDSFTFSRHGGGENGAASIYFTVRPSFRLGKR